MKVRRSSATMSWTWLYAQWPILPTSQRSHWQFTIVFARLREQSQVAILMLHCDWFSDKYQQFAIYICICHGRWLGWKCQTPRLLHDRGHLPSLLRRLAYPQHLHGSWQVVSLALIFWNEDWIYLQYISFCFFSIMFGPCTSSIEHIGFHFFCIPLAPRPATVEDISFLSITLALSTSSVAMRTVSIRTLVQAVKHHVQRVGYYFIALAPTPFTEGKISFSFFSYRDCCSESCWCECNEC